MYAHVGDRLVIDGDPARTGLIIEVLHEDGSLPYVVRWLATGHIAMVSPGHFARIIPPGHPAGTGQLPLSSAGRCHCVDPGNDASRAHGWRMQRAARAARYRCRSAG